MRVRACVVALAVAAALALPACERGNADPVCDPAYPDVCIFPTPPRLDCRDIPHRNFRVVTDPHGFDRDNDGLGCDPEDMD